MLESGEPITLDRRTVTGAHGVGEPFGEHGDGIEVAGLRLLLGPWQRVDLLQGDEVEALQEPGEVRREIASGILVHDAVRHVEALRLDAAERQAEDPCEPERQDQSDEDRGPVA